VNPVNSRELVERLWADVRLRERVETATTLPDLPVHEQLTHQEALRYLNMYWDVKPVGLSTPPGRSLKHRAKRRAAAFVLSLFGEFLEGEREFRAHVVRVSNSLATGHDRVSTEVRELAEGVRSESRRLIDEINLLHRLLEERVEALEQTRPDR
jgi:hypothetical protein